MVNMSGVRGFCRYAAPMRGFFYFLLLIKYDIFLTMEEAGNKEGVLVVFVFVVNGDIGRRIKVLFVPS
jgi:hypothetical protein